VPSISQATRRIGFIWRVYRKIQVVRTILVKIRTDAPDIFLRTKRMELEIVGNGTDLREDQQTVVFRLADESYGIEIFRVNEIIRLREITPVPRTEQYVKGLVNLRGKTIPVIDLRSRFSLPECEDTESSRIIVVDSESGQIGVVVDAVTEVLTLHGDQIESTPALVSEANNQFVRAVAKTNDKLITLLDLDHALAA
jgi:purine-binding chemotaxis protein CheW